MRRRLETWRRRWWRGAGGIPGAAASVVALPLEIAYRAAIASRNRAYDAGWLHTVEPPLPVISVGNVHVGGTGKTPVAAWIAGVLRDAGEAPALLIRGYGGDEVALHRRWNPGVPVLVAADRVAAARTAAARGRLSAVLDDGFQHRRLARSLDLALVPVEGPPRPRLLPRGPLREPLGALRRADWVLLTRRTASVGEAVSAEEWIRRRFPGMRTARVALRPAGWRDVEGEAVEAPAGPVLAVAGIARPESFAEMLRREGAGPVELAAFPDHHPFSEAELRSLARRAGDRPLAVTEKDAVRLRRLSRPAVDLRVLHLRVVVEEGEEALRGALLRAVRRSGARRERPRDAREPA